MQKQYHELKVHLVEEQKLEMVPNATLHEVIARIPCTDISVDYREEKRTATVLVAKPREEEHIVHTTTQVPVTVIDPCTGCAHHAYKQVPVCRVIKVTVYDQVPETRTYTVKVPVLRPVEKEVQIQHFALDLTPQPAVIQRLQAIPMTCETCYHVPLCPVPGPGTPAEPSGPKQPELPPPAKLPADEVPF
jgi:hypothetical protein